MKYRNENQVPQDSPGASEDASQSVSLLAHSIIIFCQASPVAVLQHRTPTNKQVNK